jgi:hypothetical protein
MTVTDEDLETALRAADAAGNVADATALAKEWQRRQQAAAPTTQAQPAQAESAEPSSKMGFFNKAIARTLGAPVDLLTAGVNRASAEIDRISGAVKDLTGYEGPSPIPNPIPKVDPEQAFGGSESIRRGMANISAPTPEREPETLGETIASVGGEVAGFALPAAALAKRFQAAKGAAGALAKATNQAMVSRPGASLATEALGATGAGTGRYVAEQKNLSSGGSLAAEVGGGLAAVAAPSAIPGRLKMMMPYSKSGAEFRASRRMQSLVNDRQAAAQAIDDLKETNLLPASRTGEPGLMALERTVLERSPALQAEVAEATAETMDRLVKSIRQSGNVQTARKFADAKRERLFRALDARVEQAGERAAAAMAEVAEDTPLSELSTVVRQQIDQALADAKVQENMLWQAVPKDTKIPLAGVRKAYTKQMSELSKAQQVDMPEVATKLLWEANRSLPLLEMDGLYKKLGEVARVARADGQRNKARIAEALREGILEDIGNAKGTPEVRRSLAAARDFSRQVIQRFRTGPVGRILATDATGTAKVPGELTLQTALGTGGVKGKLGAEAIQEAGGPQSLEAVQSFIKRRFTENAIVDGAVDPNRATTFIRQNGEMLDLFPTLRQQLQGAKHAEDVQRRITKSSDALRRRFQKPEISDAARFLNAPVDQEVKRIFGAPDPAQAMSAIVKTMRRDATGKALQGLKAGVAEHIIDRISTGVWDVTGRHPVSGRALQKLLQDGNFSSTLKRIYTPSEMAKLQHSADLLAVVEKRITSTHKLGNVIEDLPSIPFQIAARVIGAKLGAKLSTNAGAAIQAAQTGASNAERMLKRLTVGKAERLITEALLFDPELMKHLLVDVKLDAPGKIKRSLRYLHNWAASRGLELFDQENEE